MVLEGDLKDISLGIIIQMICMERLRGGLMMENGQDEGVIYFDSGQIVHAQYSMFNGVEAIHKMLSWDRGRFKMTDGVEMPDQTIHVHWSHLLMDGIRKVDEGRRLIDMESPSAMRVTEADREQDAELETDLLHFISKLEQIMYPLGKRRIKKKPYFAFEILAEMVNEVVEFCEVSPVKDPQKCSLLKIMSEVLDQYPQARILHVNNNRISEKTALNMYRNWADDPADRRHFTRQVCRSMILMVEMYLNKYEAMFRTPAVREEWQETCRVFLTELQRNTERIPF